MNVKNTPEWKAAEWDYCGIQADLRMPAFRSAPSEIEIVCRLRGIARRCPQFYPAVMELGLRLLSINGDQRSVRRVAKAFRLMGGELKEAGIALRQALQVEPKDPVAAGNLEIYEYLGKHGGNYFDYLRRPLDRNRIDRLADQEKWDRADSLRADYNNCRTEAFAQSILLESPEMLPRLPRLLATLRVFFHFVDQLDSSGVFLNEDISLVHTNFKPIMHKFIFKFGDVDRETTEDVFEALMAYYGFLASRRIVNAAEFKDLRKTISGMKVELIGKMERYNAIRHDQTIEDERKEAIREELFEGDHAWPHI
jgi:hypothetical protein